MATEIIVHTRTSLKYWYLPLVMGIVLLIVGVWVFLTPVQSYIALSMLFAATFLLIGIIEIVYALSIRKTIEDWGWTLGGGIINFIIGILLVSRPEISLVVLPFYVGFAILFRSFRAIGWSFELKRLEVSAWGNLMAVGILGMVFAFILLWNPIFAGMTIVFYTAMAFISAGIFEIYLSFRLKKLNH